MNGNYNKKLIRFCGVQLSKIIQLDDVFEVEKNIELLNKLQKHYTFSNW